MSALIAAVPGWRYVYYETEQGGAVALPIVAWRETGENPAKLSPLVLGYESLSVEEVVEDRWFVAILPPDAELADFIESAEQVAKANEEADEREERRRAQVAAAAIEEAQAVPAPRPPESYGDCECGHTYSQHAGPLGCMAAGCTCESYDEALPF